MDHVYDFQFWVIYPVSNGITRKEVSVITTIFGVVPAHAITSMRSFIRHNTVQEEDSDTLCEAKLRPVLAYMHGGDCTLRFTTAIKQKISPKTESIPYGTVLSVMMEAANGSSYCKFHPGA